jgi:DNA polymerase III sliding clamp (beta) subunit (PCNA family)
MDIEKKELKKAIGLVVPGIARKETFDQADKLAFEQGKLISYNDEVSIFHPLSGTEEINGAIDGRKLYELLNRVTADTVTLTQNENELRFKCGSSVANFKLAPVVLPFSEIDWSGDYEKLPEGFKNALKLVASTCARDMSRPVLTCVYMFENLMIGSDGYRVSQFTFDSQLPTLLLPVTAAELIAENEIKSIALGENGEWVRFMTNEETVICARLSTGNYPDLSKTLDVTGDEITLPKSLIQTLERAQIFSKRDHRIDEEVQVTLRDRGITVRSNYDGGRFEERVRGSQVADGEFTIHPDLFAEALSGEDEASCILDRSRIKFVGPGWEHVVALR